MPMALNSQFFFNFIFFWCNSKKLKKSFLSSKATIKAKKLKNNFVNGLRAPSMKKKHVDLQLHQTRFIPLPPKDKIYVKIRQRSVS